jgi:hypothetical protein
LILGSVVNGAVASTLVVELESLKRGSVRTLLGKLSAGACQIYRLSVAKFQACSFYVIQNTYLQGPIGHRSRKTDYGG